MGDESARLARSTVLRLRGLPFQATEADIEHFFQGYKLKQCSICKRNGRATGEAFVQLESEALAARALNELNCKYVGRRYIELFEAMESDIVSNQAANEMKSVMGFVLRLRGLPYSATRDDVELFFEGLEICKGEEGVVFSVTSLGKPTGEAYVEFVTEESQQEAMKKHKEHMGSRYIELFKSTKADLLQALQQNRFYREQAQKRQMLSRTVIGLPSSVENQQRLRMQGYNFSHQIDDVTDVLKGLNVRERSPLVLSPSAAPFQSQSSYNRLQNFRAPPPPPQQYLPRQSGYVSPQYFVPELPGAGGRPGGAGRLYSRGGGMYEVQSPAPPPRGTQAMHRPPEGLMRPQGAYVMRPAVMQQPHHQMVMRYPTQATWLPEQQQQQQPQPQPQPQPQQQDHQQDPLGARESSLSTSFAPQYMGVLPSGVIGSSPSGPIQSLRPGYGSGGGSFVQGQSLPGDMFEEDESFDFVGQSAPAPAQKRH